MSKHATTPTRVRTDVSSLRALVAWHDRRPRASMSSPRGWVWAVLLAASLFWMSNPLVFVRVFDDSVAHTVKWTAIVCVLTLPWLRLPRVPWPWVLFLLLSVLSQLWTINDASTDTSIVLYLTFTVLAVVAAANCEAEVIAWGLGLGGVVLVVLSIYSFEKTMWGSSYPVNEGNEIGIAFAGVGTNENILAYSLAVSLAAMLALGRPRRLPVLVAWIAVLGVHAYGFYLASSGTGYLAAFCILLTGSVVIAWTRLRGLRGHVVLASVVAAAMLGIFALTAVTLGLDKQLSTVSGRAPFWRATIAETADRAPFLGSGWGAVWEHPWDLAPPNPVAGDIYERAGVALAHGHNFFIDVLPELGLLGVLIAVVMVGYAVRAAYTLGLTSGSADPLSGRLVLLVLVSLLVSGASEPMLTVPIGWWSLTLVVASSRQRAPRIAPQPGRRADTIALDDIDHAAHPAAR